MDYTEEIKIKVQDALVKAGSSFREDKKSAYRKAILAETNPQAKWVMEQIMMNADVADRNHTPLCDDTGIPHLFLEVGPNKSVSGSILRSIYDGVMLGLDKLPGRPMSIMGSDEQRIDQSGGLDERPSALEPAPLTIKYVDEDVLRLHVLMLGGGPAIRGKTYRIFHKHSVDTVKNEIVEWSVEAAEQLGCTPCTLAIGIGRSHYEAAALMIEAQVYGKYDVQSNLEKEITKIVNERGIGVLGLHGSTTALATFLKVGPQRASGVRIVCMRPCCCFEPRIFSVEL